jgi:hypothetical protein
MKSQRLVTTVFRATFLLSLVIAASGSLVGCCKNKGAESPCADCMPEDGGPDGDIAYDPTKEGRCCQLPTTKAWTKVTVHGVDMLSCKTASQCNYSGH